MKILLQSQARLYSLGYDLSIAQIVAVTRMARMHHDKNDELTTVIPFVSIVSKDGHHRYAAMLKD